MALAAPKDGSSGCNADSRSSGSSGSDIREPTTHAAGPMPSHNDDRTRTEVVIAEAEADIAHVVNELRNVTPSWLACMVAQYPGRFIILVLLGCILGSIPAAVFYPKIDTSLENLTIRDHPLARDLDIYNTLRADADDFWQPLNATAPSRRLLADHDDTDVFPDLPASSIRRLLSSSGLKFVGEDDGTRHWQPHSGRRLHQSNYYPQHVRSFVEWTLHVVYHRKDNANMFDPATLAKMKAVENELMALPSYGRLCVHESYNVCRRPVSFVNYVYGQILPDNTFRADASADKQNDPIVVARVMAAQNFTWLFGDDINYVNGTTSTLRSELMFGRPADGFPDDDISRTTDLYKAFCKEMYSVLKSHIDDDFKINFGGEEMTAWEIRKTLFHDGMYTFAACGIVIAMLALSTRSPFLTLVGTFQLLIAFPLAYSLYASQGYRYLGIIQFLAPFVTLGIGLDDIFVFLSTYKLIMQHEARFSVATRLELTFHRASQAILATTATSSAAFASNIISPVPAVSVFSLLLALLVTVNFVLVLTWMPVCVVFWDRYLRNRCTKNGERSKVLPDEEEMAFKLAGCKSWASAAPGPVSESRDPYTDHEHAVPTTRSAHVQPLSPSVPEYPQSAHYPAPHELYVNQNPALEAYHAYPALAHAPPGAASSSNRHMPTAHRRTGSASLSRSGDHEYFEQGASAAYAANNNTRDALTHQVEGEVSLSESRRYGSCTPEDMHYAHMAVARATSHRFIDVRQVWGRIFDLVWACRFPCIALCVVAVVIGAISASRLEKSDSVPALFPRDTNVQYFLDLWYKNYSSDSIFGCPQCIGASSTAVSLPPSTFSPPTSTTPSLPAAPPTPRAAGSNRPPPSIAPNVTSSAPPPPAAGTPTTPSLPGAPVPSTPSNTPPAPSPPAMTSPLDPTYSNPNSPISNINVDPNSINNNEVKENTIKAQLIWGPTRFRDSGDHDPFAPLKGATVDFDTFDLSTVEQQTAVYTAMNSLFTNNGTSKQSLLATTISANVLDDFKAWCTSTTGRGAPCVVDPTTKLPTGDQFHVELWTFLNSGGSSADVRAWRRYIGYDNSVAPNFQLVTPTNVPRAKWLRIEVATATTSVAPSSAILDSYNAWQDWADGIRQATDNIGHFRVAATDWAVSVTQQAITQSIVWSLVFSAACTIATVLVFTGSFIVTGIAGLTLMGINIWMLGLYQMIGWKLGAIEGISITFLMGISEDFCIHISHAYVHSRRNTRFERAKDALQWTGGAMLVSGLSTSIVALPLIFATTLVLKRFATIIGASMVTSLIFTYIFTDPMLGMLGPTNPAQKNGAEKCSCVGAAILSIWRSGVNRAALCCAIILTIILAVPAGMDVAKQQKWLPVVLGIIVLLPFLRVVLRAVACRGRTPRGSAGGQY